MDKKKIIILISSLVVVLLLIVGALYAFTGSVSYEVISDIKLVGSFDIEDATIKSYDVVKQDNEYYLVICYGEQSVYYSTVDVVNVKVVGKIVTVDVKLPEGEGLGDSFSYPKTAIKFDKKPLFVKVNFE